MTEPQRELATIWTLPEIVPALRARKENLDVSFAELDDATGLPDGYSAKALSPSLHPRKNLGNLSLPLLLRALGVRLALIETASAAEMIKTRGYSQRRRHNKEQTEAPRMILLARSNVLSISAFLKTKRSLDEAA